MERDYDAEFAAIIAGYHTVSEKDLPLEPNDPDRMPTEPQPEAPGSEAAAADPPEATHSPHPWLERTETAPIAPIVNPSPIIRHHTPPRIERAAGHDEHDDAPPPGIVEADLDEGHFEPAPVQLPPQEDLHFWGVVIGLVAGPLLLLWVVFFAGGARSWWGWIGTGLTLGGFALLILRQPTDRDDEDDGARV